MTYKKILMEVYWIATQIITASQAGATEEEKKSVGTNDDPAKDA